MTTHEYDIFNNTVRKFPVFFKSEIARCLEDNEFKEFKENVEAAEEVGYDINSPYGKEVKTKRTWRLLRRSATISTLPMEKR